MQMLIWNGVHVYDALALAAALPLRALSYFPLPDTMRRYLETLVSISAWLGLLKCAVL